MLPILIIVPTLNSHEELPKLVRSLTEQTFKNWRVLFIDGNSNCAHRRWLTSLCNKDPRFEWKQETGKRKGIFAAMNEGLEDVRENEWILFWGSDDLAGGSEVFSTITAKLTTLMSEEYIPHLYICTGQYFTQSNNRDSDREQKFKKRRLSKFIWRQTFHESLFWGSTPPHQATLFGPRAWKTLKKYDTTYTITADLDYFLRLSRFTDIRVCIDETILVLMGDSGISSKKNIQRIVEVIRSYQSRFGYHWIFPFLMRYIHRIRSLVFT